MRSGFLLLLAAFIWGIAFVAQSVGMDYMGPCTFNASRFLIGGIVLLPVIWTKERMEAKKGATGAPAKKKKFGALLPGGRSKELHYCLDVKDIKIFWWRFA